MQKMEYREIPYVNKPVSRILFGTLINPIMMGGDGSELLDAIYATGVNTFDTARSYMLAELSLGNWIAERGLRDKVVILTKCGHPSMFGTKRIKENELQKDFMRSTRYLQTNYIDIYLLHRDDPEAEVGPIVEIFNAMHGEGKIGAFGGSNWTHQRIAQANEYAYKKNLIPFSVSSPNFGLAEQVQDPWGGGCITISGSENEEARKWYSENQMPVIAYSSLGRGLLSGKVKGNETEKTRELLDKVAMKGYGSSDNFERLRRCEALASKKKCSVPQIAMAWLFKQDINTLGVISTSSADRMQENIEALQIELTQDEMLYLNLSKEAF